MVWSTVLVNRSLRSWRLGLAIMLGALLTSPANVHGLTPDLTFAAPDWAVWIAIDDPAEALDGDGLSGFVALVRDAIQSDLPQLGRPRHFAVVQRDSGAVTVYGLDALLVLMRASVTAEPDRIALWIDVAILNLGLPERFEGVPAGAMFEASPTAHLLMRSEDGRLAAEAIVKRQLCDTVLRLYRVSGVGRGFAEMDLELPRLCAGVPPT